MYKLIQTFLLLVVYTQVLIANQFGSDFINAKINTIKDQHTFYGMASYYNNLNYYIVDKEIHKIDSNESIELKNTEWLAIVGRFNVLLLKQDKLTLHVENEKLIIDNPDIINDKRTFIKTVSKPKLTTIAPELDKIRYYQLWTPLAWLAKVIESALTAIQTHLVNSWGLAVVIFAVLLKLLLLPIGIMTTKFQRKVSQVQSALAPKLAEIKQNYDGEEAHNRLMAAHKELGVSPFYTLRPMLGLFIQIPILIATFNALGEMPQFTGQSFLWIKDLAYPDAIMQLPFTVSMFGDTLNLLPFLMTIITIYSTIVFQNKHAPEAEVKRQKRNLYMMAFVFFVLFYPFPAVMVLYWTLSNTLHIIQQKYVEI